MGKLRIRLTVITAMLFAGFLAGCGLETVNLADTVRPIVTSTTPANAAVGVSLAPPITATFSKAMTASTLNATTFLLSGPGGATISGAVSYSSSADTATFTPAAALSSNTTYVATITTGAKDTALPANSLAANYVWSFTTGSSPIPPTVLSTIPLNGATNVPVSQMLSATFSTAMNAATVNASTFTVSAAGKAIAGTVNYNGTGNVATFSPAESLPTSTTLVATITTGAQDTAGIALAANYAWTFTTAAAPVAPMVLSTNPLNLAAGVALGVDPSATFSTAMAASTINTDTFTLSGPGGTVVAGSVNYTANNTTATFTPASPLLSGTTYVATVTTGAQNAAGIALASNYSWSFTTVAALAPPTVTATTPVNAATGVTVGQAENATFSTAMNAATINSATFSLQAPGGVAVAGVVSYSAGTNSATFTPATNLAYGTTYIATISAGAQDAAGTPLAGPYSWSFTTAAPPPPPTVISTVPTNEATGVLLTQAISATFSTGMNPATLTNSTFTVATAGGVTAAGVITYNESTSTATFTPSANLATSTTYVATITVGAQSSTGINLVTNYEWVFRTVPAPAAPTVISTVPVNDAAGVALNQSLSATFSVAMIPSDTTNATFTLTGPGGVAVAGSVNYSVTGSVATFAPTLPLAPLTTYVATTTTGNEDLSGVPLANNYVWTFTTGAAPNTTRPTVIATNPVNAETAVPFNQAVSAIFSAPMDPSTITATSFTLTAPGGVAISGLVSYAAISDTATFTPMTNLSPNTTYTSTITTVAADLAGNRLLTNYVWTFTTGAAVNTIHPLVTLTSPLADATNVPTTAAVSASFSEGMDPLTITTATFTLTGPGTTPVAATISYDAITSIATLTPTVALTPGTTYTATVTAGAADLSGNALVAGEIPNPWVFTTGEAVVVHPVDLGTAALFGGFGGGAGMTNMGTSTVVNGNIGTTGVSTKITGFHDNGPSCTYTETPLNIGYVNGTIDTAPPPPTVGCPNEGTAATSAIAVQAAADAQSAYNALVAFPNGLDVSVCPGCGGGLAGELGNRTLAPGIYKSAPGNYTISAGNLTLDAKGDPNAYWVFQMSTTLNVGTPETPFSVLLVNGAQAANVYWQVGTAATINGIVGGGTMSGTIISQAGISVSTAGVQAITTINGRALVLIGPVTLVNTVINVP